MSEQSHIHVNQIRKLRYLGSQCLYQGKTFFLLLPQFCSGIDKYIVVHCAFSCLVLGKWFPLQGGCAHSLNFFFFETPISIQIFPLFFLPLSNLSCVSYPSIASLSSSISTVNLSCLLATIFSSLRLLSNSFSSPRFNLLRVGRRCFSWSSVSDDLFFSSCTFFGSPSCSIFFSCLILSLSFLCS